ncbi:MAG: RNA polymerase factor sigma-54 [Opitutales bacterium]|nr:RNA polymerase factor sigma-54 [Opitutales bacterium]
MEIGQNITLKQAQIPTLKMYQGLKILQASALGLQQIVKQELESNPMLEEVKSDPDTVSLDEFQDAPASSGNSAPQELRDYMMSLQTQGESFEEHMISQAAVEISDANVLRAFSFLLNRLDERGYLEEGALEEGKEAGLKKSDLEAALEFMQTCEPAGVGARSWRECFLIQLRQKGMQNSLACKILETCADKLQKRRIFDIANALDAEPEEVEEAIAEISALDPSPAKNFRSEAAKTILPDVVFEKIGGVWQARLTKEYLPRLRINDAYRQKIAKGEISKKEDKTYIKTKLNDAKNIIEAIENRQSTLLKIANCILEAQLDFFEKGEAHLKPLTMQSLAEKLGLHHTTISRAVAEKYAKTGSKLLPLRYFFSSGYSQNDKEVSSTAVKSEIKKIIASENPQDPYSDSEIADLLEQNGIKIARRTIAKYREALSIPARSLRKRLRKK